MVTIVTFAHNILNDTVLLSAYLKRQTYVYSCLKLHRTAEVTFYWEGVRFLLPQDTHRVRRHMLICNTEGTYQRPNY